MHKIEKSALAPVRPAPNAGLNLPASSKGADPGFPWNVTAGTGRNHRAVIDTGADPNPERAAKVEVGENLQTVRLFDSSNPLIGFNPATSREEGRTLEVEADSSGEPLRILVYES